MTPTPADALARAVRDALIAADDCDHSMCGTVAMLGDMGRQCQVNRVVAALYDLVALGQEPECVCNGAGKCLYHAATPPPAPANERPHHCPTCGAFPVDVKPADERAVGDAALEIVGMCNHVTYDFLKEQDAACADCIARALARRSR